MIKCKMVFIIIIQFLTIIKELLANENFDDTKMNPTYFIYHKVIGTGSFGKVYLVEMKTNCLLLS